MKIVVTLPDDRTKLGSLSLEDDSGATVAGPFEALGKADGSTAAANGNPSRDPTQPYGDTPPGTYSVSGYKETGNDAYPSHSYGDSGAVALQPVSGDAQDAANNGREGILIHGGDPSADGGLRPTNGCVRLSDEDMAALLSAIAAQESSDNQCEMVSVQVSDGMPSAGVDDGYNAGDPPPSFLDNLLQEPPAPVSESAPQPAPDPTPDPTPDPEPGPDPAPEPDPAADPGPTPEPDPMPDPAPGPDPAPDPGSGPGGSDGGGDAGGGDGGGDGSGGDGGGGN